MAKQFSVTETQIQKDLNLIFLCGLPGYTHAELIDLAFEDGFVFLIDGQNLEKPPRFTAEEISRLRLALMIMGNSTNFSEKEGRILKTLLAKIDKNNETIDSLEFKNFLPVSAQNKFDQISKAISIQSNIEIRYQDTLRDMVSVRVIKPLKMFFLEENFYLDAYENISNCEKTFRIDRILEINLTDSKKLEVNSISSDLKISGVFRVTGKASSFALDHKFLNLLPSKKEGPWQYFSFSNLRRTWLIQQVFQSGGELMVVEPEDVADEIRNRAYLAISQNQ